MCITRLEDFSNEIFYEIFEYLDGCFVYNCFSTLNTRFHYLVNSPFALKLNLSWTSTAVFEHNYKSIILPNINRIISLHIPNPLTIKHFISLFSSNQSFIRLESLNVGRIDGEYITIFLVHLKALPRLLSLSINIDNSKHNINIILRLIVLLPILKYFKISSENDESLFSTPILLRQSEQPESTIEHLNLQVICEFQQIAAILSYTPRLTHLICHSLHIGNDHIQIPINVTNLKKLSIQLDAIPFTIFQTFINRICFRLEVLRVSAKYEINYLDANKWQQLISCQMPHLRIFDFQFKSLLCDNEMKLNDYDQLIENFNNEYWYKKKWFFTYQYCRSDYESFTYFYSIHPYRRNYYKFYEKLNDNRDISTYGKYANYSCSHILIKNQWTINNCSIRFPYATKLTLIGSFANDIALLINSLNRIIYLTQITELVLAYDYLFMNKLLILLRHLPNIHSLTLPQTAIIQSNNLSSDELETISIVSKNNHIKKVSIVDKECSTVKQLRFLFDLCPQIEYLTINIAEINEDLTMKFLISKMKENNYRFFLLCIARWDANNDLIKKIHWLIDEEKLLDHYTLEFYKGHIYLWC